jgi:site-specific recombinase XerD
LEDIMTRKSARQPRSVASLLPSWELRLVEDQLSENTIAVYMRTGRQLTDWLVRKERPQDADGIGSDDLRAFLLSEVKRTSAVSAHQHWRNLRVLFKWLIKEGERTTPDPMAGVKEPVVVRKIKPILSAQDQAALLRTCQGTPVYGERRLTVFEQKRDQAILDILIDTGVRVSGVADMLLVDVKLADRYNRHIKVILKGGDEHLIPLGRHSAASMDRYLRLRSRHPEAESEWLWLGLAGRKTDHFGKSGVQAMVRRRGKWAKLPERLGPHWFRRGFAHDWLSAGGSESDGMRVAGWKTRAMITMYAEDLADERARKAHRSFSPRDRL